MRVKNVEIAVPEDNFGTKVRVDELNHTAININGVDCPEMDGIVTIPSVKDGDKVDLKTRHSEWSGVVVSIYSEKVVLRVDGEGVFESFRAGLSGLLGWETHDTTFAVVQTSLYDHPVPWDIYVATKAAANCSTQDAPPIRDQVWSQLIEVCMRTATTRPVPEWW